MIISLLFYIPHNTADESLVPYYLQVLYMISIIVNHFLQECLKDICPFSSLLKVVLDNILSKSSHTRDR